jgi:alanine-alpha-ketoisovalerate/valine-pyruvate aminotransferase
MGEKFTNTQIVEAVKSMNGMIYLAARQLCCTPQAIYNRMAKSATIREAVDDSRGEMVDISEQKLRAAVMNGEPWAVAMVLKTLGKSRGYVERQEVTGAESGPIELVVTYASRPKASE